jgi:hypothetical protein
MSELLTSNIANAGEVTVEVLQPFRGVLGRQVDVVVKPPINKSEWNELEQASSVLPTVDSQVYEGSDFTRIRLIGEDVDSREVIKDELKDGLAAIRGIAGQLN